MLEKIFNKPNTATGSKVCKECGKDTGGANQFCSEDHELMYTLILQDRAIAVYPALMRAVYLLGSDVDYEVEDAQVYLNTVLNTLRECQQEDKAEGRQLPPLSFGHSMSPVAQLVELKGEKK